MPTMDPALLPISAPIPVPGTQLEPTTPSLGSSPASTSTTIIVASNEHGKAIQKKKKDDAYCYSVETSILLLFLLLCPCFSFLDSKPRSRRTAKLYCIDLSFLFPRYVLTLSVTPSSISCLSPSCMVSTNKNTHTYTQNKKK